MGGGQANSTIRSVKGRARTANDRAGLGQGGLEEVAIAGEGHGELRAVHAIATLVNPLLPEEVLVFGIIRRGLRSDETLRNRYEITHGPCAYCILLRNVNAESILNFHN